MSYTNMVLTQEVHVFTSKNICFTCRPPIGRIVPPEPCPANPLYSNMHCWVWSKIAENWSDLYI